MESVSGIALSLFVGRLQSVCDDMGATLRRSAFSPNIRDRLDYSCAVFDAKGQLCAQAAHIPVHLGSMAYAMGAIVGNLEWTPGDMLIFNDPFLGGTHLPDVTLVAPVFASGRLFGFVANRAHHADIGCARPGSMPMSMHLNEEGLLLSPQKLLINDRLSESVFATLFQGLRNPRATLGDLHAQISANRVGRERLRTLYEAAPPAAVGAALRAINAYGERIARATMRQLPDGVYRAQDVLDATSRDSAATLAVAITIEDDEVGVDFTGSSPQLRGNLNCPISVTAAAVYYAFFCLMPRETPACAGSLRPLRVHAPTATLVNASPPAAVAAGNVETSQRIVDVVLRALAPVLPDRIPAASCGSMNNVAMGGSTWDYYETIGGGGGAHACGAGLDATHTHMTNTLNTPIEIIEGSFPLRIRRYAIRAESGGAGRYRGGAGILREYEFLAPAEVTLLTERRVARPWGLAGGGAGLAGENRVNGELVPGMAELSLAAGARLTVATPGGGGWGAG